MTYLIDTDWVIDALEGASHARALLTDLRPAGLAISVVTYLEVYEGILGGRDRRQAEQAFRAFLNGTPVLGITLGVAKQAAAIRVDLRRRGRPVTHRAMDLLIAATALSSRLTLVSRNTRDYADVTDLRLYERA